MSLRGPLIFNFFINDIFYFSRNTKMYKYADENTVSYAHKKLTVQKAVVEIKTIKHTQLGFYYNTEWEGMGRGRNGTEQNGMKAEPYGTEH